MSSNSKGWLGFCIFLKLRRKQNNLFTITQLSGSQNFWSQNSFTHFRIIEDTKELLFVWVTSINIYHSRN